MIIKRQYEILGILLDRDPASRKMYDQLTSSMSRELYEMIPVYGFTLHEAGMGCGLPGEVFNQLLVEFDKLDHTSPYDNGLTYRDVSGVACEPSRQGRAIRIMHLESASRGCFQQPGPAFRSAGIFPCCIS